MTSEERKLGHLDKFATLLDPDEEILIDFSGIYAHGASYGKTELTGTVLVTQKRMMFTGKAKFASGYAGMGKAGKVITVPFKQVVQHLRKKHHMIFIHTAEHEGKAPGKTRKIKVVPHNLKDTGLKKETKDEWVSRVAMIFDQISDLIAKAKA